MYSLRKKTFIWAKLSLMDLVYHGHEGNFSRLAGQSIHHQTYYSRAKNESVLSIPCYEDLWITLTDWDAKLFSAQGLMSDGKLLLLGQWRNCAKAFDLILSQWQKPLQWNTLFTLIVLQSLLVYLQCYSYYALLWYPNDLNSGAMVLVALFVTAHVSVFNSFRMIQWKISYNEFSQFYK